MQQDNMNKVAEMRRVIKQWIERIGRLDIEWSDLGKAHGRVVARDVISEVSVPAQNESLRDGYAIQCDFKIGTDGIAKFENVGEIGAGERGDLFVSTQQVCRVMTGAVVPDGCRRVVPQERCRVDGETVYINQTELDSQSSYIKGKGSDLGINQVLATRGAVLSITKILECASAGMTSVEVYKRPKVSFFCSGQELATIGQQTEVGQKYSTNQFLLRALIRRFGCTPDYLGTVDDTLVELKQVLSRVNSSSCDVIISTGGTGPGKYDLLQHAVAEVGGEIFSTSLAMHPGKTFLTGQLNGVIYCGLPGPPMAVETLFYEIIGPVLVKLQGVTGYQPAHIKAFLEEEIHVRVLNVIRLKSGIVNSHNGKCYVRLADKREVANCNIVLEPNRSNYRKEEIVEVHLKSSPFDDFTFGN